MDSYPAADRIPDPSLAGSQYHELMEFLNNNRDMRKAAKHSMKQGLWAGGGAVAGGLVLGPVGGLIGGIAGSLVGFMQSDNYDGVVQQVLALDRARQERLVQAVSQILKSSGANAQQFESPEAFRAALYEFASKPTVRDQMWRACVAAIEE